MDGSAEYFAQHQDQPGLRIQGLWRRTRPGCRLPVAEEVDCQDAVTVSQRLREATPLSIGAHRAMNQNDRLTLSIVGMIDLEPSLRQNRHHFSNATAFTTPPRARLCRVSVVNEGTPSPLRASGVRPSTLLGLTL